MKESAGFSVVPGGSKLLAGALVCAHLAAGTLALGASGRWAWRIALTVALGASLYHGLRRTAACGKRAIARLELRSDGSVQIVQRDGASCEARLGQSTFISPWLVILVLSGARLRPARTVILPWDSLPDDDFRRLRVWLRWAYREDGSALN